MPRQAWGKEMADDLWAFHGIRVPEPPEEKPKAPPDPPVPTQPEKGGVSPPDAIVHL